VELYADTVELPDGRVRDRFHRIVVPEFSITVALTPERRFVMVREYKHGPAAICLNAPAGGLADGEDPLTCARRELLEETGYAADDWRALGAFVVDGSTGCGRGHVFLARDAKAVATPRLDDLEEIEVVLLDERDVRAALFAGEIAMMPTACALGLALLALS
jgi:ADP-ribose pyrophosphatase